MKHGYRLYSLEDHRYYGGVFETSKEVDEYAVHMGIGPDRYEIRPGKATWFDAVPSSAKWYEAIAR